MHVNLGKVTKTVGLLLQQNANYSSCQSKDECFIDSFISYDDEMKLIVKSIYNNRKLANKFIDEVKIICSERKSGYGEVSSYIVSAIFERIKN